MDTVDIMADQEIAMDDHITGKKTITRLQSLFGYIFVNSVQVWSSVMHLMTAVGAGLCPKPHGAGLG